VPAIVRRAKELHPYEVPGISSRVVDDGYLDEGLVFWSAALGAVEEPVSDGAIAAHQDAGQTLRPAWA
jgi:hypothetical protein